MTCIVGLISGETIYMGADSAGVNDANLDFARRKDSKVFKRDNMIIGFTSSFRMGQLLRFDLKVPEHRRNKDVYEYMVTDFMKAVRKCFLDGGFTEKEHNVESGGEFIVGYRGRLFHIMDDFQVGENEDSYLAIGSGESFALGSLYSSEHLEPDERVELALSAAENFNAGVRSPFVIEKL